MKFYCLGGKSFEADFKNHMLSTKHDGLFQKKITIQGRDGRKVFIVLCTLRKLANSPNPPWKKAPPPKQISLWPGVICFFKVMMKGSIVFNSDCLENSLVKPL